MTIDEMHITVGQDLQKINTYANANILREEIDFHLNRNTRNFVDNVVGKLKSNPATTTDFQENQRLLDSIHTLHVKNYYTNCFIDSNDTDLVFGILPANYRHLVKDSSELARTCNTGDKTEITSKVYTYLLPFLAQVDSLGDLELEIEGMPIFTLSSLNGYADGVDIDTKYQLVNLILDAFPNMYWERYNDTYKKNTFIYVSDKVITLTYSINGSPNEVEGVPTTHKVYRFLDKDALIRRPNRLNKDVNLDFVRIHPFEKTTWESPISTMSNGKVFVYQDADFKVKRLIVDYIRRPITVSKSMSVNSDLPEDAQERILEQTIIHLKGIIQDPSWQIAVQQNQLNTK